MFKWVMERRRGLVGGFCWRSRLLGLGKGPLSPWKGGGAWRQVIDSSWRLGWNLLRFQLGLKVRGVLKRNTVSSLASWINGLCLSPSVWALEVRLLRGASLALAAGVCWSSWWWRVECGSVAVSEIVVYGFSEAELQTLSLGFILIPVNCLPGSW